jgi:hypothetical protein
MASNPTEPNWELTDLLEDLIDVERTAISVLKAAVERLIDRAIATHLMMFQNDHERHVRDINDSLSADCEASPRSGEFRAFDARGGAGLEAGMGDDRRILEALKTSALATTRAYETALLHPAILPEVGPILQRSLADERRHLQWIEQRLQTNELRG